MPSNDFTGLDYQETLDQLRVALANQNERLLRATVSNNINVIISALEFAADRAPE